MQSFFFLYNLPALSILSLTCTKWFRQYQMRRNLPDVRTLSVKKKT
ncbi:hypothetical protein EZS27_015951 [termite gut metagenome]|uniref:Uncharacterized protein n=1 Tax=termite gut metagenome TaxID=433724 RepID=A0A5J4RDC6_9ZZZZ